MVKKIGTLTSPDILVFDNIIKAARFEHHKIYVKVTNLVSEVALRVEDRTIAINTGDNSDVVNLNATADEIISTNGVFAYVIENTRLDGIQLNMVSGDATLEVYFTGW